MPTSTNTTTLARTPATTVVGEYVWVLCEQCGQPTLLATQLVLELIVNDAAVYCQDCDREAIKRRWPLK